MKCFHPRDVRKPTSGRFRWIQVPCGKCIACMRKRQNDWAIRLLSEARYSDNAYFLTFTQDDDHVRFSKDGFPTLCKKDMQDFWKRLNSYCSYRKLKIPRFFYCGEYGDGIGLRPHYHAIAFDVPGVNFSEVSSILESIWKRGFVTASPVTPGRCKYVAKYCCKGLYDDSVLENTDVVRPFCSYVETSRYRL